MATAEHPLEQVASKWWIPVLIGLLSVAVGILALAYEGITLLALGLIFGINILLYGMFALMAGFEPGAPPSHAVLRTVIGILAILAGLVLIVRPGASVLVLLIAVGFWFIITGVGDLVRGITQPGQRVSKWRRGDRLIADGPIATNARRSPR
jgi:uncharacterized membrane protein HdeD (DUF308 family)